MIRQVRPSPWIALIIGVPIPLLIVFTRAFGPAHPLLLIVTWIIYGVSMFAGVFIHDRAQLKLRERAYRADFGLCLECGYNLRGIVGRCPECGTEIQTKPAL